MKTDYDKIPEWTGHDLTNGAFLGYAEDVLKAYAKNGFDSLALQTLGPQLQAAINRLAPFINKQKSYSGTVTVARADATRDALFKSLWYAWYYAMQVDDKNALYPSVLVLKPIMEAYKGAWKHELVKETKEINGLQRELETSVAVTALKELGLYKIAGHLFEANTAVDTAYDARSEERGKREMAKEGETTASLRKEVATLLVQCSRRVNGAADFTPSEAVTAAIASVIGLIKQYKLVAAQPAHQGGGDTPDPSPTPDPDPDPAPDPSGDGSQNSEEHNS